MIVGEVNLNLQPIVTLEIQHASGDFLSFEAKLDTGFNGDIVLPHEMFEALRIEATPPRVISLATGQMKSVRTCSSKLRIAEREEDAVVLDVEDALMGLIGMVTFLGFDICLDMRPGGPIRVVSVE